MRIYKTIAQMVALVLVSAALSTLAQAVQTQSLNDLCAQSVDRTRDTRVTQQVQQNPVGVDGAVHLQQGVNPQIFNGNPGANTQQGFQQRVSP